MSIDDKIDVYLKKLYEAREYTMFATDLYGDDFFMNNVPHIIDQTMIERGLISVEKEVRMLKAFGMEVSQNGGWKQYLNRKQEAAKQESERLKREDLKLSYDLKVSRFSAKTIVWFFIISCVSLILSIYTLLKEQIDSLVQTFFSFFK